MMLFRSAKKSDLEAIHALAEESGVGMTTLPKDKLLLTKRLALSSSAFKNLPLHPEHAYYFFVLEDAESNTVVGTSAIEASTGRDTPFYSYKLSKRTRMCHSLHIRTDYEVLSLVNDHQGRTELCTLYLTPDYRHSRNGLLLSKSRFLFMAQHPQCFAQLVIAEMRGIADKHGVAPFWENIGRHFFHMSFKEADELTLSTNKQFIADLMPRNPVYVKLLSQQAQDVIGKPHETTVPAMSILMREGFRYNQYVDIFDAGPTLEAPATDIATIAQSRTFTLKKMSDAVRSIEYLLANTQSTMRATVDYALTNVQDGTCIISKDSAELLQVKAGDTLRLAPLKPQLAFVEEDNND